MSYSNLVANSVLDPKEFTAKAEVAVLKALALDERLADAHLALANFKVNAWDWAAAEQEYKRAIELNPNLAEAHRWYANYLGAMKRHDEAIAELDTPENLIRFRYLPMPTWVSLSFSRAGMIRPLSRCKKR